MLTARPGWRTSTHSSNGADCVEVEPAERGNVRMRHSKHPAGPAITFSARQWTLWLTELTSGEISNTNGVVDVSVGPAGWVVTAVETGAVLRFTPSEVAAFLRGARDREFDVEPVANPSVRASTV